MPLESGARLGHYEVISPLGAGGMGEVYKARDPRLNRTVAIKILPAHITERAELREPSTALGDDGIVVAAECAWTDSNVAWRSSSSYPSA
jgi:hypothetical protein